MDKERCADVKQHKDEICDKDIPGALWILFDPCDADLVRNYLNEKEHAPAESDPIHRLLGMLPTLSLQSSTYGTRTFVCNFCLPISQIFSLLFTCNSKPSLAASSDSPRSQRA